MSEPPRRGARVLGAGRTFIGLTHICPPSAMLVGQDLWYHKPNEERARAGRMHCMDGHRRRPIGAVARGCGGPKVRAARV